MLGTFRRVSPPSIQQKGGRFAPAFSPDAFLNPLGCSPRSRARGIKGVTPPWRGWRTALCLGNPAWTGGLVSSAETGPTRLALFPTDRGSRRGLLQLDAVAEGNLTHGTDYDADR